MGGSCPSVYRNVLQGRGLSFCLPSDTQHSASVSILLDDLNEYVIDLEARQLLTGDSTAAFDSWALDRINQRYLPLDGTKRSCTPNQVSECSLNGTGTVVFVIDSGVNGFMEDFNGRYTLCMLSPSMHLGGDLHRSLFSLFSD